MKICANILCQKVFETKYNNKKYCSESCRKVVNTKAAKKAISELPATEIILQIIKQYKIEAGMMRFVKIYKNSSIDAIRQLINLPPLETKEANRYINLIEYD